MKEGIDITGRDAETVRRILSSVLPHSSKVLVFGSRANWSAKEFSDLDIAVDAGRKLRIRELAALEDGFAESDLPFRVDLVDLKSISEDFAERVLTQGKPFSYESGGDWAYRRLGEVLELKRGYDLPQQERRSGNVPIISSSGEVGSHDAAMADAPGVVTGRYGTIGKVFFVDRPYWPLNTALYVREFRGNDPKFVYYLLKTLDWAQFNDKSGVPGVNRNHVHELSVKIPPLPIQKSIARTLGSLDDKIELNRRMNGTLEAMAQAIFRDWFVSFGPTRRKLEGATDPLTIMGCLVQDPERAQALADLFPPALGDDGLPEGWKEGDLGHYADLNAEILGTKNAPSAVEYVDLANTKWGVIESTAEYLWKEAPSRARRVVRRGDTIVGTVRPGNGSYAYVGRNGLTASTGFAALRPRTPDLAELIYCCATSRDNIERLDKLADGGAYPAVRADVVLATPIPVVLRGLTQAFHSLAAPVIEHMEHNKEENRTLAATRDFLLPKLVSGEIRLQEAQEVLEAAQ